MDVLAGEVIGVFAHVERADQHGAGRFQPLDQRGIARGRRMRAIDLGAGDGGEPSDVEQVLHRERHAGERQLRLVAPGVDRLRLGAGAFGRHGGEGIERGIEFVDARQRVLDHGSRGQSPEVTSPAICAAVAHDVSVAPAPRVRP